MVCGCEEALLSVKGKLCSLELLLCSLRKLSRAVQALLLLHWLTVCIVGHLLGAVATLSNLIKLLELLAVVLGHLLTLLLLLLL